MSVTDIVLICCIVGVVVATLSLVALENMHKHKWKVIDELTKDNGSFKSKVYVMQCEDCGKLKSKEIK